MERLHLFSNILKFASMSIWSNKERAYIQGCNTEKIISSCSWVFSSVLGGGNRNRIKTRCIWRLNVKSIGGKLRKARFLVKQHPEKGQEWSPLLHIHLLSAQLMTNSRFSFCKEISKLIPWVASMTSNMFHTEFIRPKSRCERLEGASQRNEGRMLAGTTHPSGCLISSGTGVCAKNGRDGRVNA